MITVPLTSTAETYTNSPTKRSKKFFQKKHPLYLESAIPFFSYIVGEENFKMEMRLRLSSKQFYNWTFIRFDDLSSDAINTLQSLSPYFKGRVISSITRATLNLLPSDNTVAWLPKDWPDSHSLFDGKFRIDPKLFLTHLGFFSQSLNLTCLTIKSLSPEQLESLIDIKILTWFKHLTHLVLELKETPNKLRSCVNTFI